VSSDQPRDAAADLPASRRSRRSIFLPLIVAVVVIDVLAFIFVPPSKGGSPGTPVAGIGDLISANLHFPAPHVLWGEEPPAGAIVFNNVSITNSLFSMWLVMGLIIILAFAAGSRMKLIPGRLQNAFEWAWEGLENWAISLGGDPARKHIPLFVGFFLFILISNWSGLIPFFGFGEIHTFRAPTSDVNVTLGLALVAFIYFQFQGFRTLGVRRYLGKFFPLGAFKEGVAAGAIALFVGLIEFLLEFIKPVTLAMRLFGNIYGGEVALGVITGLTIALIPAAMVGLEFLLNFMQALIFSVLTLMFTIIATEAHDDHAEHEAPEGNIAPDMAGAHPAPAH
jgi:F-type H+-transporting ATPase subunit a